MQQLRALKIPLLLLFVALLLRVLFVLAKYCFNISPSGVFFYAADSRLYDGLAQSLLRGEGMSIDGHPTAHVMPLYPLFLAVIYLIAGRNLLIVSLHAHRRGRLCERRWMALLKRTVIFALGFLLLMLPWWVRNYAVFGQLVLASTEGGGVFWLGTGEGAKGRTDGFPQGAGDAKRLEIPNHLSESEREAFRYHQALKHLRAHPESFIKAVPKKFINMWRPTYGKASLKNRIVSYLTYGLVTILSITGIIWSLPNWKRYFVLYLYISYHFLFHIIYTGGIRFRFPVEPVLIVFAAYAVTTLWIKKRKRESDEMEIA